MNNDNGGATFPVAAGPDQQFTQGISLRDWFAGKSIEGLLSSGNVTLYCHDRARARELAQLSYLVADAMLAERNKERGE